VELDDVFVLKNVVAVDHLALVFGFAPDAGILQLPGKIHMNSPGHIQDRWPSLQGEWSLEFRLFPRDFAVNSDDVEDGEDTLF